MANKHLESLYLTQGAMDLTEQLQKECHSAVQLIIGGTPGSSKLTVQDATNVWLFAQLAKMQLRLKELENGK